MKKKSKFSSVVFIAIISLINLLFVYFAILGIQDLVDLSRWDDLPVVEYTGPCEFYKNYTRASVTYKLGNGDIVHPAAPRDIAFRKEEHTKNNYFRYYLRETPFGDTSYRIITISSADNQTVFLSEETAKKNLFLGAIVVNCFCFLVVAGTIFVYVYFKLWPKIAPKIKHYKNRKERERKKAKRARQQRREREYIGRISWLKPEEGGRTTPIPFNTNQYGPLIRHKESHGSWSILVNNYEQVDEFVTLAKMQYLNLEDSPDDLSVGLDFALYEGSKKVAVGKIIDVITPRNN